MGMRPPHWALANKKTRRRDRRRSQQRGTNMSDDLEQLKKAREVLIRERRIRVATIVKAGDSNIDDAMDAFVKVQNAIESVELAIERLQDEEEMDDEQELDEEG